MFGDEMDVGFVFDSSYGEKSKFFNIDGSIAQHVYVWVEASDDKRFWMGYLKNNDEFKFFFKLPSDADPESGTASDGCERLFHFETTGVIVLGVCQIFCLDGDDTYLKSFVPGFTSRKTQREFVYNTNVYAIENAFLNGELIDSTVESIIAHRLELPSVCPSDFICALSVMTFPLMKRMAFYEVVTKDSESAISYRQNLRRSFRSLERANLSQGLVRCNFYGLFSRAIEEMSAAIIVDCEALGVEADYAKFEIDLHEAGVSEKNSYLFLKGHFIFDSATKIYTELSKYYRNKEIERVRNVYRNSSAQAIEDQVRSVEKGWMSVGETLKHNFYNSRPNVPFLDAVCQRLAIEYKQN